MKLMYCTECKRYFDGEGVKYVEINGEDVVICPFCDSKKTQEQ